MEKCEHEKVYANYSYASNPPQTPWVCKKCGEKGVYVPQLPKESYGDILKRFES